MTWIKDHKFLSGLAAGTMLAVVVLAWFGSQGSSRYADAKQAFSEAAGQATQYEQLALYPAKENLESKKINLAEYRKETTSLQQAFDKYRSEKLANISPQEFSSELKAANEKTRAAFGEQTVIPNEYFCGFEAYKTDYAPGKATGILAYQLSAVQQILSDLAAAGATQLINIHRPELEEEAGSEFKQSKDQVARELPIELTFKAPEKSVREFLSKVASGEERYFVIRSLQVKNEKQTPPKTKDAKFERSTVDDSSSSPRGESAIFGNTDLSAVFGNDGEASAEAAAPAPAPVDTSRILSQVLGNEELVVFVRIDILQFLPAKELP